MCVIIAKPAIKSISIEDEISPAWNRNPDGGGLAYIKNGKIITFKSLDKTRYINYIKANKLDQKGKNVLFHMRIKTHGPINLENTHPFIAANKEWAFAHNGVISPEGDDKNKLDTLALKENVLDRLPEGWMENSGIIRMLSHYIGYSKLLFLTKDDNFFFVNKEKGTEIDGIWYSNRIHKSYSGTSRGNQSNLWEKEIPSTSREILESALKGHEEDAIIIANSIKNKTFCVICGLPLVGEEAENGVCTECLNKIITDV